MSSVGGSDHSSQFDLGPGGLLLENLINSIKGKDNLTDSEIAKCHIIGSMLSTSILRSLFESEEDTSSKEDKSSNEPLSRRLDEAAEKCGVPLQDFLTAYQSYLAALGGDGNWNSAIDSNALKLKILTEDEVEKAKTNVRQAALNRTIYRFEYPKSITL